MSYRLSTVYALSSGIVYKRVNIAGLGKCGVAVVRVSGKNAKECILKMTLSSRTEGLPQARKSVLRKIIHPYTGEILDKGLVLWFPSPKSFTGEDCVEFHIHGGPAVCKAVLSALGKLPKFTPAEPDLTSIEGLGDLIHAETEAQRRQAFKQMEGSLFKMYSKWRNLIIDTRANIEAYIDFSEEENIEKGVLLSVRQNLDILKQEIVSHLQDSRKGERLKSGLNLTIIGKPNAGKSSFLNALVQRPAAIVSPIAGTTRDVVKVSYDIGGYPVNINDTAGLHASEDIVEIEGIHRAFKEIEKTDIAIIIIDAVELVKELEEILKSEFNLKGFLKKYFYQVQAFKNSNIKSHEATYDWLREENFLILVNKVDLITKEQKLELENYFVKYKNIIFMSLVTFEGFDYGISKVKMLCESLCGSEHLEQSPYLTSQRQRTHIEGCYKHLLAVTGEQLVGYEDDENDFLFDLLCREETLVLAAQRLSLASTELGKVTGHITTEDILDKIFSSFCIGK
ncbi:tRNA modification GTPase GTPBP3, mitochondrial [Armadillidium nasatum]|uniref:tRNA modification GTPase GTPBP3, mitochondrial n=1 Tax=Armadillidium nasatum TaxID=96803 RepID=A0A5N5SRX0_9CRUS|nr:tRNA modification GTPase GTPBP3, mitochondrial [Armadillidium nasatum]